MATMTVRSTYALDPPTALTIRELAATWGTSQAEVIRRSVQAAKEKMAAEKPVIPPMTPAQVIDYYRSRPLDRSHEETAALIAEMRRERHLASEESSDRLDRSREKVAEWLAKQAKTE